MISINQHESSDKAVEYGAAPRREAVLPQIVVIEHFDEELKRAGPDR